MSELNPGVEIGSQDFTAGFLDTPEPDSLPQGATPDAKNCLWVNQEAQDQQRSTLRRRFGSMLLNPIAIASAKSIDGIWQFDREGQASILVVLCNGSLYTWDGANTFNAITNGGGFTAGTPGYAFQFKNNLHVTDGTQQLRYDGTAAFPVGFAAPTGAPALAVAAGPGVTGTYEGFAVWLDVVTGHLSSPSAISAQVAFANQQRQWTKPAGAPPANVTHWRIYCRRVDTNEVNYFQTGLDQTVATGTYTESVSDTARTVKGPLNNDNDVPPVFAFGDEWKQYRLAVKPNSSDLYVSAVGDAESQNAANVLLVGGRGDAKEVRSIRKFGTNVFIRKPTKAYTLTGDKMPFQVSPAGAYGSVSHAAGIEVDGLWYDWDESRGPYVTDMAETWTALGDNRIKNILATVNRAALNRIRVGHSQFYNLILWAVPTSSTRKRTLLPYNYKLQRWLPPITGMEYSCLTAFTTSAGALDVYFGDEWGRVYKLFSGDVDGPPSGTTIGVISAATNGTITSALDINGAATAFYTTGSGLAGMPAAVLSPAGAWQWVRIQSNTAGVLTLDTVNGPPLNPVPDPTQGQWQVLVGGIEWYWTTPANSGGTRLIEKRPYVAYLEGGAISSQHKLTVQLRVNRSTAYVEQWTVTFPTGGMTWGVDQWGVGQWGASGARAMRQHKIKTSFFEAQLKWFNYYPGQPFYVTAYGITADLLRRRRVGSV